MYIIDQPAIYSINVRILGMKWSGVELKIANPVARNRRRLMMREFQWS
jgi:hypothetical protein